MFEQDREELIIEKMQFDMFMNDVKNRLEKQKQGKLDETNIEIKDSGNEKNKTGCKDVKL